MIARVTLIARIARKLPLFDSLKKAFKCLIHAAQHILQDLRRDFLVFWPFLFDSWELLRLLGERGSILACEGLARLSIIIACIALDPLVGVSPFFNGSIL